MKRFVLGMIVGILAVSAFWNDGTRPSGRLPMHHVAPAAPVLAAQSDPNEGFPPVRDGRESVGDIPVPIVPGTRVTEAQVRPPQPRTVRRGALRDCRKTAGDCPNFAESSEQNGTVPLPESRVATVPALPVTRPRQTTATAAPPTGYARVICGRFSATEDRARDDVRQQVDHAIHRWLEPAVSPSWTLPAGLREGLVKHTEVKAVEKDIEGERVTMYEASQTVDLSPAQRTVLVEAYHRELIGRRLAILAGIIAFVLACLAALAGYIRADEATKGYYSNRLRLVSAAGVGAAGVVIYRLLA